MNPHTAPTAPAKPTPAVSAEYRATHGADGYRLGSSTYPNNRAGRRAMARTWRKRGRA